MKLRKLCAFLLAASLLTLAGCANGENAVFVQSVADLDAMGSLAANDRFAGMVVSEHVTEIHKDSDKTVAELKVQEGQDVTEGQELFTYDVEQLQLTLDKQLLELEQLKATIENYKLQIEELKRGEAVSLGSDKLQYTIQIQTTQIDLKEAELNLQAKEKTVAQSQELMQNTTVTSPVAGRVTSISESGMDNQGNPLAYITIQQAGSFRIKGSLGELQRGVITEGVRLKAVSRTDESLYWYGTVTLVDYESPSQGSTGSNMMIGGSFDPMTTTSNYPFYVELDSTEGLLLGQHVYLELATEETGQPTGPVISSAFICYDEEGNPYVWAEDGSGLEKRSVTLGQENYMLGTVEILEGLELDDYIAFPDPELCVPGAPTTRTEPVDPTVEETGVN